MGQSDELNEELLRILGQHLASLSVIATVQYFPAEKKDRVVAQLVESYYPEEIDTARLELRFRMNGDFNIQYIETWDSEQWACRWDRHPNTHNTREHFHQPPRPRETTALDASYPSEPSDILRVVLETLKQRINAVWATTNEPVYPAEYEFTGEYGDAYLQ
ncbi:hypothetical protein D3D02_16340 [Halobellus sp. Atlit-38R]|uniref:hypothetical protein n=1 Tax=Halobellus sp. Atlit-38R TaxID=2282131 RepID=UPI000EF19E45|nr:hypothetical protein [Halobellus sp. Atlit-38R]RLM83862.1 hypothetical protein D3D02_16340 [Halobellus sp. Atlit-38R]